MVMIVVVTVVGGMMVVKVIVVVIPAVEHITSCHILSIFQTPSFPDASYKYFYVSFPLINPINIEYGDKHE